MTPAHARNPFPGPAPFQDGDAIFGRDREIAELVDRLIADRLVMLYSPSGAGKSSLLNAGVLRRMRDRRFHTHAPIRVGLQAPAGVNPYVWSCATSLEAAYSGSERLTDMLVDPARVLLVFDQFEELVTAGGDEDSRIEFLKQLGEALRVPGRWAVFAIREDYLAAVDDYLEWLPTQLASRMRINILSAKQARSAIVRPVEARGVSFEEGAVDGLVRDLATHGWVEPVQLQVVCRDVWEEMDKQSLSMITNELVTGSGTAENALEKYYGTVVRQTAAEARAIQLGVTERNVRDWFEALISDKTRVQVVKSDTHTGILPNEIVEELDRAHLIRSDTRRNQTWCELTHDRLILPITRSNREWKKSLNVLQREAELWVKNGSRADGLLRGSALAEGAKWARRHPAEVNQTEQEFLRRSLAERRKRRLVICGLLAGFAWISWSNLVAEQERLKRHQEVIKQNTARAVESALQQPLAAAAYLSQAERDRAEDRGMLGKLLEATVWKERAALEDASLRDAYLALTVQHDPRFVQFLDRSGTRAQNPCVWFSGDGAFLWAATGNERIAFGLKERRRALTRPVLDNVCPARLVSLEGRSTATRFDGPPGWSISSDPTEPDKTNLIAPGRDRVRLIRFPDSSAQRVAIDSGGHLVGWIPGECNCVKVSDLKLASITTLFTADRRPLSIEFSPDGSTLAVGCQDSMVRLWHLDVTTKGVEATVAGMPLRGHSDAVSDVAFSPDGRWLATTSADGGIGLWNLFVEYAPGSTDSPVTAFVPGGPTCKAATGPRGREVACEVASGARPSDRRSFAVEDVYLLNMSLDGKHAAAIVRRTDSSAIEMLDLQSGSKVEIQRAGRWAGDPLPMQPILASALSGDGRRVACAGDDANVAVWEVVRDTANFVGITASSDPAAHVRALAFLPDGETLMWATDKHTITFGGHRTPLTDLDSQSNVVAIAVAPDGSLAASLDDANKIRFWDVVRRRPIAGALEMPAAPRGIAFDPGGRTFHVLMARDHELSWNIDLPGMKMEACRMGGGKLELCGTMAQR